MKVIVSHFTALFDFCSAKYSSANYIFDVISMLILQFSQNTSNVLFCYAKYSLKCCAKYRFLHKLLRKIQGRMLRVDCANYRDFAKYNKPFTAPKRTFLRF